MFEYTDFAYRTRIGSFKRTIVNMRDFPSHQARHKYDETFVSIFTYSREILDYCNGNRIDGKTSVSGYNGKVHALIGPVFDIDSEGDIKKALTTARELFGCFTEKLGIPAGNIACYFSGHKGFHLYPCTRIWGASPCTDLNLIFRSLRKEIIRLARLTYPGTIDQSCNSKTSLLRLPNSINFKSGLFKIQLTPYELFNSGIDEIRQKAGARQTSFYFADRTGLLFDGQDLMIAARDLYESIEKKTVERPGRKSRARLRVNGLCPAIVKMLDTGFPSGKRNESALRIISALNLAEYSLDETKRLMLEWNAVNDQTGELYTDRELSGQIDYIYRRGGYNFSCLDSLIRNYCPINNLKRCRFLKSRAIDGNENPDRQQTANESKDEMESVTKK